MSNFYVRKFKKEDSEKWDQFVRDASISTILHTRKFLSYHGDRFEDFSVIVFGDSSENRILAVFPAAISKDDSKTIVSHPGATFGGLVVSGRVSGLDILHILEKVCAYYASLGFSKVIYKAVPYIYHRRPSQDDLYALFRMGARRVRCDLSACIDLNNRGKLTKGRKWAYRKALRNNVTVTEGLQYAESFWDVLTGHLNKKYGKSPVHTYEEIAMLARRFPDNIVFCVGTVDNSVVAGVVLFENTMVSHCQYIAANEMGYDLCALDAIIEYCIGRAKKNNKRYFDFGTSNENDGLVLNQSLHNFKLSFGAGCVVYEFYEMSL